MDIWEARQDTGGKVDTHRNAYGRDRARIIHSAFFRRLQGKTQVLGLGESDFYRTRLTHSIEVAQIASGIVEQLHGDADHAEFHPFLPSLQLVEAIALAHDIGHPPFGHGGEVALNYCMREAGGFEGNAQTLRIATRLGEYSPTSGLNLTRRTLLGLIKYPVLHSSVVNQDKYRGGGAPSNLDAYKPPKCVFDCDAASVDFVLQPLEEKARQLFMGAEPAPGKHARSRHKSFDTSIMELADDIAYGVHDLEDAIALRFVSEQQWRAEVHDRIKDRTAAMPLEKEIDRITAELFSGCGRQRKHAISFLVGYFIRSCTIKENTLFSHRLFGLAAGMCEEARAELDLLQGFVVQNVVKTAEVQTLEYKGQQMVIRLFDAIADNPTRLLPEKQKGEHERYGMRAICDYLAGTTDDYATRLYHKMFTPSSGSVFDRL
ncbi:MAG: anti-phage deoxyguanosine triphosphatase [Stenotrophomonas sp.]|uniref:anti-phage deoxyguanosine triphosphatase n=1 Tax=Stenotrophomonas sp. TaxID=69392 RepID=UPI002FCB0AA9